MYLGQSFEITSWFHIHFTENPWNGFRTGTRRRYWKIGFDDFQNYRHNWADFWLRSNIKSGAPKQLFGGLV